MSANIGQLHSRDLVQAARLYVLLTQGTENQLEADIFHGVPHSRKEIAEFLHSWHQNTRIVKREGRGKC